MTEFEKYTKLKSELDFVYKGIHLNRVVAGLIWGIANPKKKTFFLSNLRRILGLRRIFRYTNPLPLKIDKPIFATYGRYDRRDHVQLYHQVMERMEDKVSSFNMLEWKNKTVLHPNVIKAAFIFFINKSQLGLIDRLVIASEAVFYCNIVDELEKVDFSKAKRYLCMANMLDIENLITQYMKLKGIPTYSLMEGIYFIFKIRTPYASVAYENFETDKLITWGQYTIDEFVSYGLSKDRFALGGYPKKVDVRKMKKNNPLKRCMIMFAADVYKYSNMAVLEMLERYSHRYEFYLKLHPGADFEYYDRYASKHNMKIIPERMTLNECLNSDDFDFTVGINTTTYYESLMRGIPCLRYNDGTFSMMYGYNDEFSTIEEFDAQMDKIKNIDYDQYQKDIDNILIYAIGLGIDNYKDILYNDL